MNKCEKVPDHYNSTYKRIIDDHSTKIDRVLELLADHGLSSIDESTTQAEPVNRLHRIKDRLFAWPERILGCSNEDARWLLSQVETLANELVRAKNEILQPKIVQNNCVQQIEKALSNLYSAK